MQMTTALRRPKGRPHLGATARLALITLGAALALRHLSGLAGAPWMAAPSEWATADPLEATVFVVWVMALVTAAWLLFSIAIGVAARVSGLRPLILVAEWATVPAVRRLAERVTAVSFVVSTVVTPVAALARQADETPPIPIVAVVESSEAPTPVSVSAEAEVGVGVGIPPPSVNPPILATLSRDVAPSLVAARAVAPVSNVAPGSHVVKPGENLWTISREALALRLGRTPSDPEIAAYWTTLIDANRGRIRSGNPDLIVPGESIELPETS